MRRRRLLLALGALAAGPVAAQEPAPQAEAPPRPAPRHRRPAQTAEKPEPLKAPPGPLPDRGGGPPRLEAAPVPNRDLEAPHVVAKDQPSLLPDVIHRRMPSRGMAAEGSPNVREDRLFAPAPGARLSVPFSY